MSGIIAFFQALPALAQIINQLGPVLLRFVNYAKQNDINGFRNKLEALMDHLEKDTTPDEKQGDAQSVVDIISGIGPK